MSPTGKVAEVDSTSLQLRVILAVVFDGRASRMCASWTTGHRRQHQQSVVLRRTAWLVRTAGDLFPTHLRLVSLRRAGYRVWWSEKTANGRRQLGRSQDCSKRRRARSHYVCTTRRVDRQKTRINVQFLGHVVRINRIVAVVAVESKRGIAGWSFKGNIPVPKFLPSFHVLKCSIGTGTADNRAEFL